MNITTPMKINPKHTKTLIILLMLAYSGISFGQGNPIPNSTWKIKYQIDQQSGDTIKYDGLFKIRSQELAFGPTEDGLSIFAVVSVEGIWDKKTHIGIVSYEISFADTHGIVKITGEKNMLMVEIVLEFESGTSKSKLFAHGIKYD